MTAVATVRAALGTYFPAKANDTAAAVARFDININLV